MVLMAIDHASFFIARVHPAETWAAPPPYYADVPAFLTRWLTHLCAPGFFMLMGIGLVWFAESRRAAGWSSGQIARFYVTRGAALLLVQHLLDRQHLNQIALHQLLITLPLSPLIRQRRKLRAIAMGRN